MGHNRRSLGLVWPPMLANAFRITRRVNWVGMSCGF